jgi:hypothetical protein
VVVLWLQEELESGCEVDATCGFNVCGVCVLGETVPGTGEVARFPAETLGTHKDENTEHNVTSTGSPTATPGNESLTKQPHCTIEGVQTKAASPAAPSSVLGVRSVNVGCSLCLLDIVLGIVCHRGVKHHLGFLCGAVASIPARSC